MRKLMSSIVGSLSLLFTGCERSLIYYPATAPEDRLRQMADEYGLTPWRDDSGVRIGWASRTDAEAAGRTAVVVFHGNAGHAAHRAYYAYGFKAATQDAPWDVFLFEYPGYGSRAGRPSESVIKEAALSAVETLMGAEYESILLAGESLGSGAACHVAAALKGRVAGVLLVTPFTSLEDVGRHHYPGFLVRLLLSERYDNVEALSRYEGRLAVLLAGRDEVVPAALGRRLYESYDGPKKLWVQQGRTHNTLSLDSVEPWWREVVAFLQGTN